MGTVVLDASALIAFAEDQDPLHSEADRLAADWRAPGMTRLLPASAYAEILVQPFKNGTDARVDAFLAASEIEIVPIDAVVGRVAASARSRVESLRLPDALVVATALVHDAELVTLDRRMADAHRELAAG
jgi:predicted nucleic acid-binding protein